MARIATGRLFSRRADEHERLRWEDDGEPRHMGVVTCRTIDPGGVVTSMPIGTVESRVLGPNELNGWIARSRARDARIF